MDRLPSRLRLGSLTSFAGAAARKAWPVFAWLEAGGQQAPRFNRDLDDD